MIASVLSSGAAAHADPAAQARYYFERGADLARRGRLNDALHQFLLANRVAPTPGTLANIGLLLERQERLEEAYAFLEEASRHPAADKTHLDAVRAALVRIEPRVARLRVTSDPEAAEIFVDRVDLGSFGKTPRVVAVPPGERKLLLRLDGHHEERVTVSFAERGREVPVAVRLRRQQAAIEVRSTPSGAVIVVDDEETPHRTPARVVLPTGPHRLRLTAPGHLPEAREVVLDAERVGIVDVTLMPAPRPTGAVTVTANRVGALVRVDGRDAGFTPLMLELPAGRPTVEVLHPGHDPWRGPVPAIRRQTTYAIVTLESIEPERRGRVWAWILGGIGAAALGGAIYTGLTARELREDYQQARDTDPARAQQIRERGVARNFTADVLYGAAVLALGAEAVWLLLRENTPSPRSRADIVTSGQQP